MGITRVADVTGLDSVGIPVVMVCRPKSRSVAVSQGKGIDLESARASGLMECAELYHAETMTLPLRLASYEELRYEHAVIEIAELPHGNDSRFDPNLRLLWCEAYDLVSSESLLVPYELVHTDFTIPLPEGHGCFISGSNGLASGNNIAEAISHGLCEVIERDATTLWQLHGNDRISRGRVDLKTIADPLCNQLITQLQSAGLLVSVWEITTDIQIATFACYIMPPEGGLMWHAAVAEGFGCHPAREVALVRAITEAAQTRLTVISGARDDFDREDYNHWLDPDFARGLRRRLSEEPPPRDFAEVPTYTGDILEDDIRCQLGALAKAGIRRVAVIDLSKSLFGFSVVRVIVPGLEPVLARAYRPGPRACSAFGSRS